MADFRRTLVVLGLVLALGVLTFLAFEIDVRRTQEAAAGRRLSPEPVNSTNELQHRSTKLDGLDFQDSVENMSSSFLSIESSVLSIYQWNPHWQCFYQGGNPTCAANAKRLLNEGLRSMNIDFGNVIELVDDSYQPPPGYAMLKSSCNEKENALLIYSTSRWRPSSKGGSRVSGCITNNDRAFNVQMFESVGGSRLRSVIVVGAHYPHYINVPTLRDAISSVVHATNEQRVVFIADTNQESGDSHDVAQLLNLPGVPDIASSPMFVSCCHMTQKGFFYKFDRVITNFGDVAGARMFDVPSWATMSMHKAVHAKILLPGSEVQLRR